MNLSYPTETEVLYKYEALVNKLVGKFYRPYQCYSKKDLDQVARLAIIKAYRKFDPNRGQLITLLYHSIIHDLIKYTNKNSRTYHLLSNLHDNSNKDATISFAHGVCFVDDNEFNDLLPDLTDEEFQIVSLLRQGFKRKEITSRLSLTNSQYKNRIKHIKAKFRIANE